MRAASRRDWHLRTAPSPCTTVVRVVEDCDADPTGASDSTAAYARAVARCAEAGGGVVQFATGTYRGNLALADAPPIDFQALGRVVLEAALHEQHVIDITGQTTDLAFSGKWYVLGPEAGACVHINQSAVPYLPNGWINLDNVFCYGGRRGVYVEQCSSVYIDRLLVGGPMTGEGVLIDHANSNDVWIRELLGGPQGQICYRCRGGIGHKIDTADIENTGQGIVVDPPSGREVLIFRARDVQIDTCHGGSGVVLGGGGGIVGVSYISELFSEDGVGSGLEIRSGVQHCYITNPYCNGNAVEGIWLNDGANTLDIQISGGSATGNRYAGLAVSSDVQGWQARGLNCEGSCIWVDPVATDHYAITGCTGPVYDHGLGESKHVSGNIA